MYIIGNFKESAHNSTQITWSGNQKQERRKNRINVTVSLTRNFFIYLDFYCHYLAQPMPSKGKISTYLLKDKESRVAPATNEKSQTILGVTSKSQQ